MTEKPDEKRLARRREIGRAAGHEDQRTARQAREAQALRANLRRRKAQAVGRAGAPRNAEGETEA